MTAITSLFLFLELTDSVLRARFDGHLNLLRHLAGVREQDADRSKALFGEGQAPVACAA
jgi:hypothetical protein